MHSFADLSIELSRALSGGSSTAACACNGPHVHQHLLCAPRPPASATQDTRAGISLTAILWNLSNKRKKLFLTFFVLTVVGGEVESQGESLERLGEVALTRWCTHRFSGTNADCAQAARADACVRSH